MKIRQAHMSDLPYIYDICAKTGYNGKDTTDYLSDKLLISQYFAAPYLFFGIDQCFVVEKNTIPYGYILGVLSTQKYNSWLNTEWLPILRQRYPVGMNAKSEFEEFLIDQINKDSILPDFLTDYPSHLHIDLLPEIQGMGLGRKLIDTFIKRLKEKDSTGLHFAVGEKNKKAIGFYKKVGFKEIKKGNGAFFMGMRF